jgi:predicted dehydrogenase
MRPDLLADPILIRANTPEWLHFRDAIRAGANVECTLEDGRRSLEIVLAAAKSAACGAPVRISEAPREIVAAKR